MSPAIVNFSASVASPKESFGPLFDCSSCLCKQGPKACLLRSVHYSSFCYLKPMKLSTVSFTILSFFIAFQYKPQTTSWIRINQLGYKPNGIKVAVWCSKEQSAIGNWQLIDASSKANCLFREIRKSFWCLWAIYANLSS